MASTAQHPSNEISLTYKFLLAFTTLSAVVFCWLYVTKPTEVVIAPENPTAPAQSTNQSNDEEPEPSVSSEPTSFAALTGNSLPGESPARPSALSATANNANIPLPQSLSTAEQVGWEETNHRVQHVLTAQNGDQSERIILEVPVIYQTRGLRFDRTQAKEAARILRAMKLYQRHIAKLHNDGKNIQKAWDKLVLNAQPSEALRADSPSLPNSAGSLPENSSATITVSQ